ncbi:MAG: excinuclease ABC subunit UvrA [Chloroflexota bacterium]
MVGETPPDADALTVISVKGARENNLKNISLEIPRDKFVVITGLSGSGKSSLAFDTLYAEGQRRYVECLSPYARQFLGMLKKPKVDSIEGLSPAISIEQKSISHNPRSTVGTVTEIYDYLRLLFAKIGTQYCVHCNIPVVQMSLDQIVDDVLAKYSGKRAQILAPLVKARKGHYKELFETLMRQGYSKVRVDGELTNITEGMQLSRYKIHDIELVVDRLIIDPAHIVRLSESIELALKRGEESALLLVEQGSELKQVLYSSLYSCPSCGESYEPLAPNNFSFNSPYGACPTCNGLGATTDFDVDLLIPDRSKSIADGAIAILAEKDVPWIAPQFENYAKAAGIDLNVPFSELPPEVVDDILHGSSGKQIVTEMQVGKKKSIKYKHEYPGLIKSLQNMLEGAQRWSIRKTLDFYTTESECETCLGGRLKEQSLFVRFHGADLRQISKMDITTAHRFFIEASGQLGDRETKIAKIILGEITSRLEFLSDVGLSYLSLGRATRTLSGGESQRIRLASQIGSKLVGIMYVLDEPSIGLHQHDNNKLIDSLKKLRDLGNSVIVVEHDKAMIESSDYFIDIGPGAGVHGGEIVLEAEPHKINGSSDKSITAQYLAGYRQISVPEARRVGNGKSVILKGATGNNLKNVTVSIPLGTMTLITGMSGSGKSTLINDTLYPILTKKFNRTIINPLPYGSIEGLESIDKVIEIDQSPIGRTPRSNPATYTGLFTLIRDFFALLPESKIRGYKSGRFSFNVKGGRCEECEGAGLRKIEMNFLPEVYVECDSCDGKRYNAETLTVHYKGKSIADVLDMTVEEANDFFADIPKIKKKLKTLFEVGLGYIKLGQQAPTLSGGEAQRVKLAAELSRTSTGKTLYLLDEPTTGLHFEDVRILMELLDKLVDKGNTVVIIEHNLDVIKRADWIIDMGPEGGAAGGEIIAEGTPEKIIKSRKSLTGKYLKEEMKNGAAVKKALAKQ